MKVTLQGQRDLFVKYDIVRTWTTYHLLFILANQK